MKENKMNMVISFVIVIAVVAVLVYITFNQKKDTMEIDIPKEEQKDIQNDGVKIITLQEGTGSIAKLGDVVVMNYTGKLADGTVFDSNIDPKFGHVEPFVFILGTNDIIKGWNMGIVGMKVGEKRIIEISPENAYGATGAGGIIPPNATISFEIELLKIQEQ